MYSPPNSYNTESYFNMGLAYLQRIHKLLDSCQLFAINQDIDNWRLYLRAVYRELSVKLSDVEKETLTGQGINELDLQTLLNNYYKPEEATFKSIDFLANNQKIRMINKAVILSLLDLLDIKIRGLLQKKGMLLPSKDDVTLAVTKR